MIKNFIIKFAVKHKVLIKKIVPKRIIDFLGSKVLKNDVDFHRTDYSNSNGEFGINYIGYLNTLNGLGQAARLNVEAIKRTKIPVSLHDIYLGPDVNYISTEFKNDSFKYNINIIHVLPGDDFEIMLSQIGIGNIMNKYNICYWVFELSTIPDNWIKYIKYCNEIWTCSEFSAEAFRKVSDVPVYVIPHASNPVITCTRNKSYFGLSNKFNYLMMFDSKSSMERKNPLAVIKAYKLRFKNNNDTCLIIKMNNSDSYQLELLKKELNGIKNYVIIDKKLSSNDVYSLISICDVLVSLHRSEGFGLVMLEAMMLGIPCVATNYSGNVDFMNKDNSFLVDYKLIPVVNNDMNPNKVYSGNNYWADPDYTQAAEYMYQLYSDKKLYKKKSNNSKKYSNNNYSLAKLAKNISNRINSITK